MNTVTMIGNLAEKPELRYFESGKCVATFRMAVKKPRSKEGAGWFNVTCWNKTAEYVTNYAMKGTQVAVRGYLVQDCWQDRDGKNNYRIKVVADEVQVISRGVQQSGENYSSRMPDYDAKLVF